MIIAHTEFIDALWDMVIVKRETGWRESRYLGLPELYNAAFHSQEPR